MSLDRLSKGPIDFGVGIGFRPEVEFGTFGHDTDARIRAGKLDEGLAVVTGMWTGEPFAYEGEHYRVERSTFLPTPMQDRGCRSGLRPRGRKNARFDGLPGGMGCFR